MIVDFGSETEKTVENLQSFFSLFFLWRCVTSESYAPKMCVNLLGCGSSNCRLRMENVSHRCRRCDEIVEFV